MKRRQSSTPVSCTAPHRTSRRRTRSSSRTPCTAAAPTGVEQTALPILKNNHPPQSNTIDQPGTKPDQYDEKKTYRLLDLPDDIIAHIFSFIYDKEADIPTGILGNSVFSLTDTLAFSAACFRLRAICGQCISSLDLLSLVFHPKTECQQQDVAEIRTLCASPILCFLHRFPQQFRSLSLSKSFIATDRRLLNFIADRCIKLRKLTFHDSPVTSIRAAARILQIPSLTHLTIVSPSRRFLSDLSVSTSNLKYFHIANTVDPSVIPLVVKFLKRVSHHQLRSFVIALFPGEEEHLNNPRSRNVMPMSSVFGSTTVDYLEVMNASPKALSDSMATHAFISLCIRMLEDDSVVRFRVLKMTQSRAMLRCDEPARDQMNPYQYRPSCSSFCRAPASHGAECTVSGLDIHIPLCRAEIFKSGIGRQRPTDPIRLLPKLSPALFYCLYTNSSYMARLPERVYPRVGRPTQLAPTIIEGRHIVVANVPDLLCRFHMLSTMTDFCYLHELCVPVGTPFFEYVDEGLGQHLRSVVQSACFSLRRVRLEGFPHIVSDNIIAESLIGNIFADGCRITTLDISSAFVIPALQCGMLRRILMRASSELQLIHIAYDESYNFRRGISMDKFIAMFPCLMATIADVCPKVVCIELHTQSRRLKTIHIDYPLIEKALNAVDEYALNTGADVISMREEIRQWGDALCKKTKEVTKLTD